jgi:DNA-binding transcriptional MerR regulator
VSTRYRVHEFAELAGVTVKALHHYDRLGLLKPARTAAGYRVYDAADLGRLEQIVALKTIGFSLKDIRVLLERDALPLRSRLSQQRHVLEQKRRMIDRAIEALTAAERGLDSNSASAASILQKVIHTMSANDWPPPAWRALYREIGSVLDTDPASPPAQALADRWLALAKEDRATGAIFTHQMKASDSDRATAFINDALWVRWADQQETRAGAGGPGVPRVTERRRDLFRQWEAILGDDPAGERAQALAVEWRALLDSETGGDEQIKADVRGFISHRSNWPTGMKRFIASLYATDAETWERVTDFIEEATARV